MYSAIDKSLWTDIEKHRKIANQRKCKELLFRTTTRGRKGMLSEIERYPRASVQVGKGRVINDILRS